MIIRAKKERTRPKSAQRPLSGGPKYDRNPDTSLSDIRGEWVSDGSMKALATQDPPKKGPAKESRAVREARETRELLEKQAKHAEAVEATARDASEAEYWRERAERSGVPGAQEGGRFSQTQAYAAGVVAQQAVRLCPAAVLAGLRCPAFLTLT